MKTKFRAPLAVIILLLIEGCSTAPPPPSATFHLVDDDFEKTSATLGSDRDCSWFDCSIQPSSSPALIHKSADKNGFPAFSIAKSCKTDNVVTQSSLCTTDEQEAKKKLALVWKSFDATEKQKCLEITQSYRPSYVEALTCLDLEPVSASRDRELAHVRQKKKLPAKTPGTTMAPEEKGSGKV